MPKNQYPRTCSTSQYVVDQICSLTRIAEKFRILMRSLEICTQKTNEHLSQNIRLAVFPRNVNVSCRFFLPYCVTLA